jgi:hypothetical protein
MPTLQQLFQRLPIEEAMPELLPKKAAGIDPSPEMMTLDPTLQAAIWLYVDDLDRSHTVSQGIETEEGSFWHGIMHRREGDFSNAKYWFRRAGSLPNRLGLDPIALTDEVARHFSDNPPHLVEAQRREWKTLYEHCARHAE